MALQQHPMWRRPQHHLDHENPHDHVHWIELFYDLIHVVIIFLLGNYLSDNLNPQGFLIFAGVFTAVWFAWGDSSVFNSLYVSTDVTHRLIMATQIVTAMVMAASIPAVTGKGWTYFALAYAANRFITAYLYHRTIRLGAEFSLLPNKVSRNFFALSVVFAISAFLPQPYGYWLFAAAIVSIQLLYMLPKIGVLECERFLPRLGHMAERFALLLLIVVGEGFFKLVVTLSEKGIYKVSPDVLFNFIFGGFAVFCICWLYFDFVGNGKPKDTSKRTLVQWWIAHLLVMLSATMIGVALAGEVKVGFWESYPLKYAAIGCIGLAVYLAALFWIQSVIDHVPAIVGNLMWGSALFSQIVIPVTKAYFTLSKEEADELIKELE